MFLLYESLFMLVFSLNLALFCSKKSVVLSIYLDVFV